MKRSIKKIRDNRWVLSVCVASLRAMRKLGVMRSRKIYSHVPYRGTVTVDCGEGRSFLIESRGHIIENGLYWDGLFAHEPESMRLWLEKATRAGIVFDIGANSGIFALAAAAMGARDVHAFEPLPRVHHILAQNVRLNSNRALKTWPYAAGSEDGTATIFDPGGEAPGSASLSADFAAGQGNSVRGCEVRVVAIDSFCEEHEIASVDLIKIDVEGYEEHALRGMREMVARSTPAILMEVLPGQEPSLRQVIEELWPGTYSWARIDEGHGHVSRNVLLSPTAADFWESDNGRAA